MTTQKIKPGDLVKIINPQIFARCGYPLCLKDVIESLDQSIAIDAIKKVTSAPLDQELMITRRVERAIRDINKGLAYAVMLSRGFGGSERKIYTREEPSYLNAIVKVESKRRVVTGNRYGGCGPGYYGDEAEGPSLENQQHHTLIKFWPVTFDKHGREVFYLSPFHESDSLEIEQIHVEKVEDRKI